MKRIIGLLLVVALSGCGITGPVPPPGTPGITNCSDTALHQAELNLLPSLENAVALVPFSSAESAIASIVAQEAITVGGPLALAEATCVIQWILSKAETSAAGKIDPLEETKASNAEQWLKAHGANVTGGATVSP